MVYSSIFCLSNIADEKHHCWPGEMKLEKLVSLGGTGMPGVKTDSSRVRVCDTPELSHQPFSGNMENHFPMSTTSQTPRKVLRYRLFSTGQIQAHRPQLSSFWNPKTLWSRNKNLSKKSKNTHNQRTERICSVSSPGGNPRSEQNRKNRPANLARPR
jgi:hypothetical protein